MTDDPGPLAEIGATVDWPDSEAARTTRLAGGDGGTLDDLAVWLSATQASAPPREVRRPRVLVVGSAPLTPTVAAVADLVGVPVDRLDGADGRASGVAAVDAAVDSGTDLLILAGHASVAAVTLVVSVLADLEPVRVLPRGARKPTADWIALATDVRDRRRAVAAHRDSPDAVLATVDDPTLAALAGAVLQAGARRTPTVIDGPAAHAAALIAYRVQPRAARWLIAADTGGDSLTEAVRRLMSIGTVLTTGAPGGDGLSGLLTVPLLRAAAIRAFNRPGATHVSSAAVSAAVSADVGGDERRPDDPDR